MKTTKIFEMKLREAEMVNLKVYFRKDVNALIIGSQEIILNKDKEYILDQNYSGVTLVEVGEWT